MNTEMNLQTNKPVKACHMMILIGATGRNSGKTTLAMQVIKAYKDQVPIAAIKLVTIREHGDTCPRGGQGCGICKGLKNCYDITEEKGSGTKDTMLLKKAGADKVFLIRAFKEAIGEALEEALKLIPENALILCESNSARLVIKPAVFVMIRSSTNPSVKTTAKAVMNYADVILPQDDEAFAHFVHKDLPQRLKNKSIQLS